MTGNPHRRGLGTDRLEKIPLRLNYFVGLQGLRSKSPKGSDIVLERRILLAGSIDRCKHRSRYVVEVCARSTGRLTGGVVLSLQFLEPYLPILVFDDEPLKYGLLRREVSGRSNGLKV